MKKMEVLSNRNPLWDSLKIMLIFMVVYGHMIETCVYNSRFNQVMYNFIYLFHMPLFVFVSGHFSHMRDKQKYLSRMYTLFETYIVFQFIRCLKSMYVEGVSLFPNILIPKGILWYLACLLMWRMVIFIASEQWMMRHKKIVVTFFLISGFAIGFIPIDGTISRFFVLGFFFFLGYYLEELDIKALLQKIPIWVGFVSFICLFLIVALFLNKDIRGVIYLVNYYYNPPIPPVCFLIARLFFYVFAIITGYLLMRLVFAKPLLTRYGNCTLAIFMLHTFIILSLRPLLANSVIPSNELSLLIYAVVIWGTLAWLTYHFKFVSIILNPITYTLHKMQNRR